MYTLVVVLHVFVSLAIIAIVLLQAGKGADIGSAFGGGAGSQAVFGSMGTPTLLGKVTTGMAIAFMATSFSLAMLASSRQSSVVTEPAAVEEPAPAEQGQESPGSPDR